MDLAMRWNTPGLDVQTITSTEQCAICARRAPTAADMFALHEQVELPVPGQTWLVCEDCASAVVTQIERSPLRSPLRVRVAVGIVAAERRPPSRHTILDSEFWDEMSDQHMNGLLAAFVLFMFLMPPLVFLLVTALTIFGPLGH